jgi:hypothetical protein
MQIPKNEGNPVKIARVYHPFTQGSRFQNQGETGKNGKIFY